MPTRPRLFTPHPFAGALAVLALVLTAPAVPPAAARVGKPPPASSDRPAERLTRIAEYDDGAVVETVDLATGERRVESTRGQAAPHHDGGAGIASGGNPCANDASHFFFFWGQPTREARPWRGIEEVRFDPDGAPVAFDWMSEVMAGSDVWAATANGCGFADSVGWVTPPRGADNAAAALPPRGDCEAGRNNENNIGWLDSGSSSLLAFVCLWSISQSGRSWIHEADMVFNSNPARVWCQGACVGGHDVRSVATHEWGHWVGLAHTCGESGMPECSDPDAQAAVMYPFISSNTVKTLLTAGDITGAETLYSDEFQYAIASVSLDDFPNGEKLSPGHEYPVTVNLVNTGLRPWKVNDVAFTLSTRDGSASAYQAGSWASSSQASPIDQNVNDQGTVFGRIPNDANTVIRDETARFDFRLKIPYALEGQVTTGEQFDVLADFGAGPRFALGPVVTNALDVGTYAAAFEAERVVPVVVQGVQGVEAWLDLRNTGTAPWHVGEAMTLEASDGAGTSRCSALAGPDWLGCTTASRLDQNLVMFEPGKPVVPGEVGRFRFTFASPVDPALLGPHTETFEPKLDAGRFVGNPVTTFTLVVV